LFSTDAVDSICKIDQGRGEGQDDKKRERERKGEEQGESEIKGMRNEQKVLVACGGREERESEHVRGKRDKNLHGGAHSSGTLYAHVYATLPSRGNQRGNKTTEGMRMGMEKWE